MRAKIAHIGRAEGGDDADRRSGRCGGNRRELGVSKAVARAPQLPSRRRRLRRDGRGRDPSAAAGRTRAGRCARASTCDPSAPGQSLLRAPPPAARPNLSFVSPISPRPDSPPACCARRQYLTAPSITCPTGMIARVRSKQRGGNCSIAHYFFQ